MAHGEGMETNFLKLHSFWRKAATAACLAAAACSSQPGGDVPKPPPGSLARLEILHEGTRVGFGPFVGYYFRPYDPADLTHLEFWCFNERGFYASDAPEGALLFSGEARLTVLPGITGKPLPSDPAERIVPVFFDQAPAAWLETRPEPRDEFVHFHSGYDRSGPVAVGYWLRHRARAAFRYDMGGRVDTASPLYHEVSPGMDLAFPRIVEFDRGPAPRR